jgi:hypothetical protein
MTTPTSQVIPVPSVPDFERVSDGFLYNFRLRPSCNNYLPLALGAGMLEVRAAFGDRRPRYHAIPSESGLLVQPTGFYEEQFHLTPGTLIWGIMVAASAAVTGVNLLNYSFRLTDLQTNQLLFSEFAEINCLSSFTTNGSPLILPEPAIVLAPGVLFAEIGAYQSQGSSSEQAAFQIILFCSEPISPCDPSTLQRQGGQ